MTTYSPAVGERCRIVDRQHVDPRLNPSDYIGVIDAITKSHVIFTTELREYCFPLYRATFQPLPNLKLIVDQIRNAETRAEAIQVARGYFDDTMHFGEVVR